MRYALIAILGLLASPALAATGPFISLHNTNFIVLLAFFLFVGILLYFGVPSMITRMLDQRAAAIRADLDEARALREEAQSLLASYERKQREVSEQADRIVASAKEEAGRAAEQAKDDIRQSVARRLAAAHDQIASAEAAAIREVRDQAIAVAIGASRDLIAGKMTAERANALIEEAIGSVETKLH